MACVSYELRLRPNKKQLRRLCETLDICMNLRNLLMARAVAILEETGRSLNAAKNILATGRTARPQNHETRGCRVPPDSCTSF